MSTIGVVGATGLAGRPLVEQLRARGHEVRSISRGSHDHPADLDTGSGLAAALEGCQTVYDVANTPPQAGARLMPERARRLVQACEAVGAAHLVCLSIVGIEYVPMGYYRGKVAQEEVVANGATPSTIVRCTQFHELLAGAFTALGRLHVSPRARVPLRPIAAEEAAQFLATLAQAEPSRRTITVSGPRNESVSELAAAWARRRGGRLLPLPLPLPPKLGRALRGGALVGPPPDHQGTITFSAWLG